MVERQRSDQYPGLVEASSSPNGALNPTRFLIATAGRTGSSWLMEMLNSHPAIEGYGELLTGTTSARPRTRVSLSSPGDLHSFAYCLTGQSGAARMLGMPYLGVKYLNRVYAQRDGLGAIGFRLLYRQLKRRWGSAIPAVTWFLPYAAARRVHIVHLIRQNKLELVISTKIGYARNLLHALPEDEVPKATIRVDVKELARLLDRELTKERNARRLLAPLPVPKLELSYESLMANTETEYRRVLEFLGVHPIDHKPEWRMRKMIDSSLSETIENYDEVARALRGTPHARFLEAA